MNIIGYLIIASLAVGVALTYVIPGVNDRRKP